MFGKSSGGYGAIMNALRHSDVWAAAACHSGDMGFELCYTLGIQALERLAQPDDIGGVVAFLASDDARWISGDIVRVDGGSKL